MVIWMHEFQKQTGHWRPTGTWHCSAVYTPYCSHDLLKCFVCVEQNSGKGAYTHAYMPVQLWFHNLASVQQTVHARTGLHTFHAWEWVKKCGGALITARVLILSNMVFTTSQHFRKMVLGHANIVFGVCVFFLTASHSWTLDYHVSHHLSNTLRKILTISCPLQCLKFNMQQK